MPSDPLLGEEPAAAAELGSPSFSAASRKVIEPVVKSRDSSSSDSF